jgi:hypothetical protein
MAKLGMVGCGKIAISEDQIANFRSPVALIIKNGGARTQYVIQLILAVQSLRVFIAPGRLTAFILS